MKITNFAFGLLLVIFIINKTHGQASPLIKAVIDSVSTDSLFSTVLDISGARPVFINGRRDTIISRQFTTAGNKKAFQYLRSRLDGFSINVDSQTYSSTGSNLFGIIKGSDTNKVIVIGAHYDNVGNPVGHGADDNASGVAAVLECARLCSARSPGCSLIFAFWDEEEAGMLGSDAYVRQLGSNGKTLLGYINLDMIGWDGNRDSVAEIHVRNIRQSTNWATKALSVNADYYIGLQLQIVNPGHSGTDQASFWNQNKTAIGINENYNGDINPSYHRMSDTAGALDLPYFTKITKLALGTILSYALPSSNSIYAVSAINDFVVHPNPFNNRLHLRFKAWEPKSCIVTIISTSGRICFTKFFDSDPVNFGIDTEAWPAGPYWITRRDNWGIAETMIVWHY